MKTRIVGGLVAVTTGLLAITPGASAATATADAFIGADYSFNVALGAGPGGNLVNSLVELSDGDFLAGGWFTSFNGAAPGGLVRLNPDGTPDTAFQNSIGTGPGADAGNNGLVWTVLEQDDGKIVVAGGMASFNGAPVGRLVRLNPDGTPDAAFQTAIGTGADSIVTDVIQLSDGDLLVSGYFANFNGSPAGRMVRLNPDGTVDAAFQNAIGAGAESIAYKALELSDGDILVGGSFGRFNGRPAGHLTRINPDGTIDTAFQAALNGASSGPVTALAELADGRIAVGGNYSRFAGAPAGRLTVLKADGALDAEFQANLGTAIPNGNVWEIAQVADGDIMVSGIFSQFNGTSVGHLVQLHPDGTLDTEFAGSIGSGASAIVWTFLETSANEFLIGGDFTQFHDEPATRIARIAPQTMEFDVVDDRTDVVGDDVEVAAAARVSSGAPVSYSAEGLPEGIGITEGTGVMSGTPTRPGDYTVTVTASSQWRQREISFVWTVIPRESVVEPTQPAVDPTDPAAPTEAAVEPTTPAVTPVIDRTVATSASGHASGSGLAVTGAGLLGMMAVAGALLVGGIAVLRSRRRAA